ncbi:hypothetical protein K490DRAFT_44720 [Saccharata proteae CBS 121410]|uniref:Autophagy-related protein 17 n=1 Tax=Saccharata proteae CBS 121410 TaxID=1314787 RepID=A0A9P4LVU7_9PEZI|nr:hypothetical protein K490DRAFT_44720 [Saccharata proteae CBS 121410]
MTSPHSSTASLDHGPPTLEQLVSHFVASKRSLASMSHVVRANEVVTEARHLLELDAVLSAKNAFVRRALDDQLSSLRAIRHGVELVAVDGQVEFKGILVTLDTSSTHLQSTLKTLRETPIHASLQPNSTPQKHLFDFIDSSSVDALNASLRQCIDRTNEASSTLTDTLNAFDDALSSIVDALAEWPSAPPTPSPLPSAFLDLELHATETASLLQSLVRHYDLCVTALKHTEGGPTAAASATASANAVSDLPDLPSDLAGIPVETLNPEDDNDDANMPPPEPMSAAEKVEMLAVLVNDAAEVEEAVAEIRDRVADMEAQLDSMVAHVDALRGEHAALRRAVKAVKDVGHRQVPGWIAGCREFQLRWDEERARIEEGMLALEGLGEFYEGFLDAYDGLLVEVGRRRRVREKMEQVAREAARKIEKLHDDDFAARASFRAAQGEHLPLDIWPGLQDPPVRYDIVALDRDEERGSVPDLPREVVEEAMQRIAARR